MLFEEKDESKIIVAFDFENKNKALSMAKLLDPSLCKIKVGLELYVSCGPSIIEELHSLGYKIFLDLKFHDITNTVVKSCLAASKLGVWMVNIHSGGGSNMMISSKEELVSNNYQTLVLGVTILTSMNEKDINEIGYTGNIENQVVKMASLCYESKLDGIVCSANEAKLIKSKFPENFICVCPGIRNNDDDNNDQKRTVTPAQAAKYGADYIVVGRPIIKSKNPLECLINIKKEFDSELDKKKK
jgi:orotidine-5'-phosphate decarboxylase